MARSGARADRLPRADELILSMLDEWNKCRIAFLKVDAKASDRFKTHNESHLAATSRFVDAMDKLLRGLVALILRYLDLLAGTLKVAFPNTAKLKDCTDSVKKIQASLPTSAAAGFDALRFQEMHPKETEYNAAQQNASAALGKMHTMSMQIVDTTVPCSEWDISLCSRVLDSQDKLFGTEAVASLFVSMGRYACSARVLPAV